MSEKPDQSRRDRRAASAAVRQTGAGFAARSIDNDDFRLLAENLPVLCWMANADGYIFWYNKRWHDYCGTTAEDMEGWGWQSVHDPRVLPAVMERWQAAITSGERFEMVFPLRGADGVFRPFLTKIEPLRDDHGHVVRWFGTNVEISDQIAAETEARESSERVSALAAERDATLRQLHEGVIVTDAEGKITFVNEAAERLHGVASLYTEPDDYSETYGLFTVDGEPHPPERLPLYRAVFKQERVVQARWVIRRPDGSEVIAIGDAGPIRDEAGKQVAAVLTIRDDTARHAAELELAEGVRSRELLIAELNHRVKNAFAVVKSIVRQSLAHHDMPLDLQEKIDARLHAYASAHTKLTEGNWERASLQDVADDLLGHHVKEGRVSIAGPGISLPARQAIALSMAFYELMSNAFKHGALTAESGRVALRWSLEEGDPARLRVEWNESGGPKIAEPKTKGFGTFLIDRALTAEMRGEVTMGFPPEGYRWSMSVPLEETRGTG